MSTKSLAVAQVMDWMLELEPVWEVPVTAAMLHRAISEYSKYSIVIALKQLTECGVLYVTEGERGLMFYLPTAKRPVCAIQEFICGRLK